MADLATLAQHQLVPRHTGARRVVGATFSFIRGYPLGSFGAFVALVLVAMAIVPGVFATHDPDLNALTERYQGVSWTHWMGQDQLGRDQYSRIVYGARTSIVIGFGVVIFTSIVGVVMGATSGYAGGWFDTVLQRLVDVGIALPGLPFIILVVTSLQLMPLVPRLVLSLSILISLGQSRIIRGAALALKQEQYVDAARALGARGRRVVGRHIVPNVFPVVLVSASTLVGSAILIESSLSFLGYGVQPPTASWGRQLNDAREFMVRAPHLAVFPGLAIFFTVYAFNMLGDAIRDKIDPRLRGAR
ncbi:MAG: ABC transporter permease [Chloroflexi bacterium]|nr:ABC transporter permease [Chloroflexota bacterium]MDA1002775.1 ABC transporter permease [Chloroflexota bacterium]